MNFESRVSISGKTYVNCGKTIRPPKKEEKKVVEFIKKGEFEV